MINSIDEYAGVGSPSPPIIFSDDINYVNNHGNSLSKVCNA